MTMHQKVNVLIDYVKTCSKKKGNLEKESILTILLSSLGFTSLHFLFSFAFTLNFSKHSCNEGEEEETRFALSML